MKEEILTRLDAIASKLGIATQHLWEVLAKQGYVEGWFGVLYALIALGIALSLFFWLKGQAKSVPYEETRIGFYVAAACALTIGTIVSLTWLYDARWIFNPEGYALQEVLKAVGGQK